MCALPVPEFLEGDFATASPPAGGLDSPPVHGRFRSGEPAYMSLLSQRTYIPLVSARVLL